jgi:predicted nucleic acid-binding protein
VKIAVQDANILMDLANGDLLEAWFSLGIETHTTDLVLAEITRPAQEKAVALCVQKKQLLVRSFDGVALAEVIIFGQSHGISPSDASALRLAMELNATLLTGDGRLRKVAESKVLLAGFLKILDLLADRNRLPPKLLATGLRKALAMGCFLPADECEKRLKLWDP